MHIIIMITDTMTITEKGQVTIPQEVRKILNSKLVVFEVIDNQILIKPVRNVAGSLKDYNKDLGSFEEVREKAWREATNEKKT